MPCDKVSQESVSKLGHWTTRQTSSTGISCCSAMSFFAMSCWLPAPRMTSGNAKCIKCIKCIKSIKFIKLHGNTLGKVLSTGILGPKNFFECQWRLCHLCHFSKSQLSQQIQGTKVQLPAALLRLEKKQPDFTTFFDTKKMWKKKHFWHQKREKHLVQDGKTPVSGPWQCAKLDRRVRAAAWHQPLPVLPNKTFIIWHVQTDMWIKWNAFTLLIRFSCFHNLVSFLPSAVLHFRSFRAAQMFSHLFKAAKVYLQSGRLPEHRHGRMELQNGTILSRHFTFRDKIS